MSDLGCLRVGAQKQQDFVKADEGFGLTDCLPGQSPQRRFDFFRIVWTERLFQFGELLEQLVGGEWHSGDSVTLKRPSLTAIKAG